MDESAILDRVRSVPEGLVATYGDVCPGAPRHAGAVRRGAGRLGPVAAGRQGRRVAREGRAPAQAAGGGGRPVRRRRAWTSTGRASPARPSTSTSPERAASRPLRRAGPGGRAGGVYMSSLAVGLVRPLLLGPVPVELDPVAVGVGEVDRLADAVVGGAADRDPRLDQALQRVGERLAASDSGSRSGRGPVRAGRRRRAALAVPGVEPDVVVVAAGREEGGAGIAGLHLEAEGVAVEARPRARGRRPSGGRGRCRRRGRSGPTWRLRTPAGPRVLAATNRSHIRSVIPLRIPMITPADAVTL